MVNDKNIAQLGTGHGFNLRSNSRFYDQYSFQIIPVMGQVVAGDWDSYLYLVQSIRKFPNQVSVHFFYHFRTDNNGVTSLGGF
jgi:ubiquinone/menaquinone biosynthesis C-methylase UbiE